MGDRAGAASSAPTVDRGRTSRRGLSRLAEAGPGLTPAQPQHRGSPGAAQRQHKRSPTTAERHTTALRQETGGRGEQPPYGRGAGRLHGVQPAPPTARARPQEVFSGTVRLSSPRSGFLAVGSSRRYTGWGWALRQAQYLRRARRDRSLCHRPGLTTPHSGIDSRGRQIEADNSRQGQITADRDR